MKNQASVLKTTNTEDFCVYEEGVKYAGRHLIIDLWDARYLTDPKRIQKILIKAINSCRATMLGIDLHVFSPNGGVSGVAVLKESHISIHTWPEYDFAAVDIFVCGAIDPHLTVPVFEKEFQPKRIEVKEIKRGILP